MSVPTLPLTELEALLRAAGDVMRHVPDEVRRHPDVKEGSANFVTAYDVKVQDFLIRALTDLFPDAHFLAEEDEEGERRIGKGYMQQSLPAHVQCLRI